MWDKNLHEEHLFHLTGVRYHVLMRMLRDLAPLRGRGRRPDHGDFLALVITLIKIKHDLTYRALEALTGLDHVTISRLVIRTAKRISLPKRSARPAWVAVDTTATRLRRSREGDFTKHKKMACLKTQVLACEDGWIERLDCGFPGSWHDKKIFDRIMRAKPAFVVIGDKRLHGCEGGSRLARETQKKERSGTNRV